MGCDCFARCWGRLTGGIGGVEERTLKDVLYVLLRILQGCPCYENTKIDSTFQMRMAFLLTLLNQ